MKIDDIIDPVIGFITTCIHTVIAYNLYLQRDKVEYILNTLEGMVNQYAENDHFSNTILAKSKKIVSLISFMCIGAFFCIMFVLFEPFYYVCWNTFGEETIKKPLMLDSWYPFDKKKNPFYQLAFLLELVRILNTLGPTIGIDCLLVFTSLYVTELYSILSKQFRDVKKFAEENIQSNNATSANSATESYVYRNIRTQELRRLQKEYIIQHILLNK